MTNKEIYNKKIDSPEIWKEKLNNNLKSVNIENLENICKNAQDKDLEKLCSILNKNFAENFAENWRDFNYTLKNEVKNLKWEVSNVYV